MRESHVSVQKDGVNGVFYCLVLLFLLWAYHVWGHFDWCLLFTSRLVLSILLCLSICSYLIVLIVLSLHVLHDWSKPRLLHTAES
jgi:hypothetical protein